MRTLYNARVGLLTPLALPGERKRFLGMDGSCERERKGEETFGMRRTGQKKEANDFRKRAASKPFVLSGMYGIFPITGIHDDGNSCSWLRWVRRGPGYRSFFLSSVGSANVGVGFSTLLLSFFGPFSLSLSLSLSLSHLLVWKWMT
jgi:hypothetical protein